MKKILLLFVGVLVMITTSCEKEFVDGKYGAYFISSEGLEFEQFDISVSKRDRKTMYINGSQVSLKRDEVKGTIIITPGISAVSVGPIEIDGTYGAYGLNHSKIKGTFSCTYTYSGQSPRKINGTFTIY